MSIDFNILTTSIKKAQKEVEEVPLKALRRVATQVDQAVVIATPRDTGRAANNWLPSLNTPILQANENASGPNGQILGVSQAVIFSANLGDTIYFSNNLPYIGKLNDGSSKQAPAGFVQKAALAAETSLATGIF